MGINLWGVAMLGSNRSLLFLPIVLPVTFFSDNSLYTRNKIVVLW